MLTHRFLCNVNDTRALIGLTLMPNQRYLACPGHLSIKLLCSACEVLVVKNTKGEQWVAKPQAHRKQNIGALYLGAQPITIARVVIGLSLHIHPFLHLR